MDSQVRRWAIGLGAVALLASACAQAATRAWLDRDSIEAGEPVTLNIETDQRTAGPDYAPLRVDFGVGGQQSSRQLQMTQGSVSTRSLFAVVLTPRRGGTLTVPALRVGADTTQPLRLNVRGGAAGAPPTSTGDEAQGNEVVFVETRVDDTQPYLQQSVGVVVRLYYATQLAAGSLALEAPEGASLQQIGEDANRVQTVNGRPYNVAERHYLLVPERSGSLRLPGARFSGRAVGGFFDDYFGRGNGELSARSAGTTLQVRAQPDPAPQPWLPVRDLRLRYAATPQRAVAGEAVQIVVEATAVGATRAQFPDLVLPPIAGAQVFPEPAQYDERFVDGSPQLKWTRRFSLVPDRAGKLHVSGMGVDWWDVRAAQPRSARLPDLDLDVAPGSGAFAAPPPAVVPDAGQAAPAPASPDGPALRLPGLPMSWPWIALAALFALLWLATLVLWLRGRGRRGSSSPPAARVPADPGSDAAASRPRAAALREAIDHGGFDEIEAMLREMAGVQSLDQAIDRLALPRQQAAVRAMQRARWAGEGDLATARQGLRVSFREAPRWRSGADAGPGLAGDLPPLYPRPGEASRQRR